MKKNFFDNLRYAFLAQAISILFSLIMYLILPKIVGVISYSYWQLFLFYTNYSGFFHLGLVDGLYLQLGGKNYKQLDYSKIGTQFKYMVAIHIIIAIIGVAIVFNIGLKADRIFVVLFTILYVILYCIENFLGFVLQAVNLTKIYSKAIIFEKIICLIFTLLGLIKCVENFKIYVIIYVLSKIVNIIFLLFNTKEIVLSSISPIKSSIKEIKKNISIGMILMFSGIASSLIIGSSRIIIDGVWGIEKFGKVSFSISIINMILLFIRQISVVLFPALREVSCEEQKNIYQYAKIILHILLPIVFVGYVPAKIILENWLPQYEESLILLALTLPICIFDAKMQILGNTYFKVLRKEKILFILNVAIMIISFSISAFLGFYLKSMIAIVISMVFCIVIRSIIAEIVLDKYYKNDIKTVVKNLMLEIIITISFMFINYIFNSGIAFVLAVMIYVIYILLNIQDFKTLVLLILKKLNKRRKNA